MFLEEKTIKRKHALKINIKKIKHIICLEEKRTIKRKTSTSPTSPRVLFGGLCQGDAVLHTIPVGPDQIHQIEGSLRFLT